MTDQCETRQRIVDSACDLIHRRSYTGVGVAEICAQARTRKGSFYHFFPSKQDLSLAVIDELRRILDEQVLSPAFGRDVPPLRRLERFVDHLCGFQQGAMAATGRMPGCPFGNLALELATTDEAIRRRLGAVFAAIRTRFEHVIEDAVAIGETGPVDVRATAEAMLAYMEGMLMLAKTANDPAVIRRLGPALARIRIPPD
ncbi:Transcriptional regulator, TetR family [Thioalkalivibrio nitratireducens DSM 14787]|uniref:Transcriptional regulator, TetR family n=1 Tax=Thioalkalivibrio nitratireducens (strain DSM 14787 / UNIQEM 213 / ALEN2) TaxID=1255043 RepID=L0E1T8_THIND|nr:TetR/AcrR family transcriptional regulator [Thioalkalivibrio nitratireducens]AGA35258.1 Transcriptional regulator, TetR family [Thioalkalivibrio nitratireducens DSM 14787]